MRLVTQISRFRAEKGIGQLELAKEIGVSRETICRLERGHYNPSLKMAYDIANYFNVTIEEMFEFRDNEEPLAKRKYERKKS